jgi:large subunit ribosomal protein L24
MKLKIKKGDNVIVSAGKSLGKQGKVVRVLPTDSKVIVEGVNLRKRREKPRREGQKGQVLEAATPIHISNVELWCASCAKGVRVGYKMTGKTKVRICRSCEKEI